MPKRKATNLGLAPKDRKNADTCAGYVLAKARYLDYPKALANGWPVATGVIEGAVRYLVKDRRSVTGARWSVEGAEAVPELRALRKNGDWERYFSFHLARKRKRVHEARDLNKVIPAATRTSLQRSCTLCLLQLHGRRAALRRRRSGALA